MTVNGRMPFRLRMEKALDDPSLQALFYGPASLVARSSPGLTAPTRAEVLLPCVGRGGCLA
ncbi:hypothetical protein BEK98_22165 [Streptomyces diastatochromogenes]|uniref:Uncharacterized protein n=1 Tax=Streptomyces diastatochromogenes TaxID=42236 RepID=A0A233SD29_STRDA|nr:hypothetical protein BEK98_22165 [Streptomyces diastatochromogenes]